MTRRFGAGPGGSPPLRVEQNARIVCFRRGRFLATAFQDTPTAQNGARIFSEGMCAFALSAWLAHAGRG
jgi:hypothetical protein